MNTRSLACVALLLLPVSVGFSQKVAVPQQSIAVATVTVDCPARLQAPGRGVLSGVPMEFGSNPPYPTQEFLNSIPSGWQYGRTQTYSGLDYEVVDNSIQQDQMVCLYGIRAYPHVFYFVSIKKAIPANRACTKASEFKFECRPKPIVK